ncbi:hypothetical protein GGTG_11705 [Gaeumannomyces tritici R3-111a-1]|uniref:Cyclin-like f-box protein n=1 Tax=Gaeumannomyces tritici (strain R3-111a-1) TaxID=644352 RepID=J3PDY2_GAET3|nr:hypothetical protein GGTG_11705 [Gaeumannomyces tritici R3-111a-1]EJT70682.1 hypothetical protein GGTG_11705 [Gaeumannomyces tritici R3-111a-1]
MSTIRSFSSFFLLLLLGVLSGGAEAQRRQRQGGGGARQTPQQQAAAVRQGVSAATDGSTILDMTATINGADIRFKISGPADQFTTASGVTGGTQEPNATTGTMGLNVLLHGDGGQSFFDFPNQAVQGNLMGVAVLAPSENLLWGIRTGPPLGDQRPDGVADAQAVSDLVRSVLPQVAAFNMSNVFFTGVSGGALVLSGFFMPAHMTEFKGTGVLLNCGALAPQVDFVDAAAVVSSTKIHFQSSTDELASLKRTIPQSIAAYEKAAADAGLAAAQINALQTVDATPNGGHCAFDGKGFVSGIQLVADNFETIMQGGDGVVQAIGAKSVLTGVVGNENPFAAAGAGAGAGAGRGRGGAAAGGAAGGAATQRTGGGAARAGAQGRNRA